MAVTTNFYNSYKAFALNGKNIDLDTDTIKVALCTSTYAPSIDNHDYFDDVTNEVSATGYTAGGATLTLTVTKNTTNDMAVVTASASTTWAASSITARYAVIYKNTGDPATSPLICYVDFDGNKVSDGDNFIIDWDDTATGGIFNLT
jgi:hypothetical protein